MSKDIQICHFCKHLRYDKGYYCRAFGTKRAVAQPPTACHQQFALHPKWRQKYDNQEVVIDAHEFTGAVTDVLSEILKGGAGSGNFGHEGRPGEVGGSGGGGGGVGNFAVEMPKTIDGINSLIEERGLADTGYFENMDPKRAGNMTNAAGNTLNDERLNYTPDKLLMLGEEDLGKGTLMYTDGKGAGAGVYIATGTSKYSLASDLNHDSAAIEAGGHPFGASGYASNEKEQMQLLVDHEMGHIVYDNMGKDNQGAWEKAYGKSGSSLGKMSDYAETDAHEGFAEAYSLYINGKEDKIPSTFKSTMDNMNLVK